MSDVLMHLPNAPKDYFSVPEGHVVMMWRYDSETNTMVPEFTQMKAEADAFLEEFNKKYPPPSVR